MFFTIGLGYGKILEEVIKMKKARDFRQIARESLKGKWFTAVIAGAIAALLGGASIVSVNVEFNVGASGGKTVVHVNNVPPVVWGIIGAVFLVALAIFAVYFVVSSFIRVGYSKFNLNVVDGENLSVDTLFSYASDWKRTAKAFLWQALYIIGWSCVFIVPGIVAAFSYSMVGYILAEDNTISPKAALMRSAELMMGNKWRLFRLNLSFIGWIILTVLTLGIGNLWLTPYMNAAIGAFYRDITENNIEITE